MPGAHARRELWLRHPISRSVAEEAAPEARVAVAGGRGAGPEAPAGRVELGEECVALDGSPLFLLDAGEMDSDAEGALEGLGVDLPATDDEHGLNLLGHPWT